MSSSASKRPIRRLIAIGVPVVLVVAVIAAVVSSGHLSLRLPVTHTSVYADVPAASPGRLMVDGARLLAEDGTPVTLRGVMIEDPSLFRPTGAPPASLFADIAATGANVVRLPVSPANWRDDKEYLWRSLEPAVRLASAAGLWVIIDWHVIGNVETGVPTNSAGSAADLAPTTAFWQTVAAYFADAPNVLFELVNECEGVAGDQWRTMTQGLVDTVRATGADNVVIIGGVQWSKDLSWAAVDPLAGENIAYAVHIYPADAAPNWDQWFGNLAATHPVLLTEWGFTDQPMNPDDTYLVGDVATYAQPLLDYVEARGMGWVACWYNDDYDPPLLTGQGTPTAWGEFAFAALGG